MSGPRFFALGCSALLAFVQAAFGQNELNRQPTPAERDAIGQWVREELRAEEDAKRAEAAPADKAMSDPGTKPAAHAVFANGLYWQTDDKSFVFHVGGRFDWDNAWFTQDDNLLIGPSA